MVWSYDARYADNQRSIWHAIQCAPTVETRLLLEAPLPSIFVSSHQASTTLSAFHWSKNGCKIKTSDLFVNQLIHKPFTPSNLSSSQKDRRLVDDVPFPAASKLEIPDKMGNIQKNNITCFWTVNLKRMHSFFGSLPFLATKPPHPET